MPKFCLNVFTNCTDPSRHAEFNSWYTHTHLPDLSRASGFVRARRFVNRQASPVHARYYAQYEFDTDDHGAAVISFLECAEAAYREGRHIDCITDSVAASGAIWEEIDPEKLVPIDEAAMDYPVEPPESVAAGIKAMIEKNK